MKTKFYLNLKSWLLMMLMLIGAGGNLWAEEVTLTKFTSISGDMDSFISYEAAKGSAGTAPAVNSGEIRVYQNGGTFKVSAKNGAKINSIVLGSSMATKVTYAVDNGDASSEENISANGTFEVKDLNCTSVLFTCKGTNKNSRLYVNKLTVTYTTPQTVLAPTFSPVAGRYTAPQSVVIATATSGATIYYTTDGSEPNASSNVYTTPLEVSENQTLKAYSVKGDLSSEIVSADYIIRPLDADDYIVDFEKKLDTYVAWDFDNIKAFNDNKPVAHGGSYYGANANENGNGVSQSFIKTKEKVSSPEIFTCYLTRSTNNTTSSTWKIQVSSDGTEWTDVKSQSATSMTAGTWIEFSADLSTYSNVYVRLYYDGGTAIRCVDDITLTLRDESKQDVTLSFPETTYEATMGSEFTAPTASAEPTVTGIEYSSSNTSVATVDANTGAVTLVAAGTTTITATFAGDEEYNGASASYTLNVARDPNGPGTQNNPYTVAQAREFIETLGTESSDIVYVSGIVSQVDKFDDKYSSITYWISDDGTTSSQLECYSGKGLESANFSSVNDIQVGDIVTVAGTLKKYNDIYEFNHSNYLVSFERPSFEIAAQANDNTMGSVSLEENVITATPAAGYRFATPAYTVTSGTATVTQDGNEFVVDAETDCTVQINFEAIPTHTVTWSINGTETTTTALEDAAVEFPAAPEAIEGKTFVGWVTEAIDGETNEAPTFVTSATMGTSDLKYYAVFASQEAEASLYEKTDDLTREFTGVEEKASYAEWSGKTATSSAVYAGQSAGDKNSIQLRSNNSNSGVISTTSGGKLSKVVVVWNSETASGRTLDIYGSNTAYEAATDLYDNSKQGTKLGSIVNGTSTELTITGDYQYIGLRSNNGAMYLSKISITWEGGTPATYSGYCTTVDVPIRISTVEELKAFRDAVNTADKTVTSKNVLLVADLDLSGEENWTPIGNLVAYPGQSFDGVFDGNGHTIKNVTVVDQTPKHAVAGLFGSVVNGTIKNLTVENVNLTSSHYAGGIVAYTSNKPIIENCHVIGGTITSVPELVDNAYDNGDKVGGIMGYATAGSTINNCTVDGLTIKAYRDMGGIVGFSAGNVTNNTVKNTTIIQSDVNAYKNEEITTYDYIVGRNGGATLENNVYEELNNVLTIDGAVAKIGDKLYRKLQAAVDAATEEDNVVTLLSDIDLASEYVNINKAVTIKGEGYTITSAAAQAILLTGEGDFTLENTNVVASKGHGIQAGNDNTAYAGTLAMEGSTLTVDKRGIRVYKEDTGFGIDINNSTIQSTKEDPTTTYTTGNDAMALSLGATDGKGYEVNVTNSTLQGFSYLLNVVTSGSNLTVNMTGGKGYGRAIVNTWGSNNTITLDGVEVHGLNNQTGPTEAFACVVDNKGAQNNTFVLKDCQFTGTLSEAALTTEGSTASEHLLQLDGMNAIVKVLGSTTYSCNSDDKSRGGIFYTESYLNNNKLYFDDTTKQTFANAFELSVIADEKEAEVDLYPVSFEPEVLYYWAVEDGYNGGYYSFADPFKNGWLADGEFIALQKNITLTEDITCQLASGTSFNFLLGDFTADKNGHSVALNTGVTVLTDKQTDIFKAAKAGYVIVETETETGYSYTAEEVMLAQPIIFHDGGEYEGKLTVAIAGEGVKYTLNGGAEQTYSAPFSISETTIVKAWAEKDGVKSDVVEKTFTIVAKQAGAEVADGYYNIKTNDGKFVNVAGRKTVTLVSDTEGKAGTVIRVNADAEGVKVLRSQGVDLPGYAKKAMNYVPEIVQLAVDKLHAEGAGELLGETGLEKIMDKFNESFDYNLYLEKDGEAYRIYGRTPSMKPVVDFYAENKANVDAKLPELEEFINKAIDKVLEKTGGRGQSILVDFDLHNVWQNMDSTLTEPTDEASTMKFYEEVLTSEANVWNFAYQTAMIYWGNLKSHPRFAEIQNNLGDYSKYIDKVENIRPNFRYYIVPSASGVDFISQGNSMISDASTAWTMEPVSEFKVEIPETNKVGDKYYTTLYTDFAYTLPEGVKAMKVTSIGESGCYGYAETKEIDAQSIAEQTPILLVSETAGSKALELSKTGSAVTDNLLKGPDYLISEYKIKTPQVESLFDMAKSILGESAYNEYLSKYEHLMLKNAGTVGNKYFFGLSKDECKEVDVNVCVLENVAEFGTIFASDKENINANKAFLVSDIYTEIRLMKAGDVNRDGKISIADVTALVNIILGKVTEEKNPDNFDFGAADVNCDTKRTIADVTALVNIILGKHNN